MVEKVFGKLISLVFACNVNVRVSIFEVLSLKVQPGLRVGEMEIASVSSHRFLFNVVSGLYVCNKRPWLRCLLFVFYTR